MRRVIVFLKYPEPGAVKTRLERTVGARAAVRLARHFAERTLAAAASTGLPVSVSFAPARRGPEFAAWLGPHLPYAPQRGDDLGERMRNAFADVFAGDTERAVLIGTDAPDRPVEFLTEALDLLDGHDVVLGPALDGGYHLIAMRRDAFAPEVFAGIDWSTPRVLAQTLDALRAAGRTAYTLPPWRDIDDRAGLDDYLEAHPEAVRLLDDNFDGESDDESNDNINDDSNAEHSGFRSKSGVVREKSDDGFNDNCNDNSNAETGGRPA